MKIRSDWGNAILKKCCLVIMSWVKKGRKTFKKLQIFSS